MFHDVRRHGVGTDTTVGKYVWEEYIFRDGGGVGRVESNAGALR